jgi:hypothetical protein
MEEIKSDRLKYVHNDCIFYCAVCHKIVNFETPISLYSHIIKKQSKIKRSNAFCSIEDDEEMINSTYQKVVQMLDVKDYVSVDKTIITGVVIYVYDLGKFLFEHLDKIKNLTVSIMQIPFKPINPKDSDFDSLDDIEMDVLYPSELCACSLPCIHSVFVHIKGDSDETWYKFKNLRGDVIQKQYKQYLPKYMRNHFLVYDFYHIGK